MLWKLTTISAILNFTSSLSQSGAPNSHSKLQMANRQFVDLFVGNNISKIFTSPQHFCILGNQTIDIQSGSSGKGYEI